MIHPCQVGEVPRHLQDEALGVHSELQVRHGRLEQVFLDAALAYSTRGFLGFPPCYSRPAKRNYKL